MVVFQWNLIKRGKSYLEAGFTLRCFQRLSNPNIATQLCLGRQLVHQRFVHPGPLVLRTALLKFPTPTIDRDRTVSRRSEPSSRTTLIGEQPNPWDLIQPQDVMSRHRGAKPPRRCELLGRSACYPQGNFYPLSDGISTSHTAGSLSPTFVTCSTCMSRS